MAQSRRLGVTAKVRPERRQGYALTRSPADPILIRFPSRTSQLWHAYSEQDVGCAHFWLLFHASLQCHQVPATVGQGVEARAPCIERALVGGSSARNWPS